MQQTKIKTIDIQAKQWFDKINGNSYFSAIAIVNYSLPGEQTVKIPFQYGYGDSYIYASFDALIKASILPEFNAGSVYWRYCRDNDIVLRNNIQRNCLKRDVKNFTN